jgi:hypothetical protein
MPQKEQLIGMKWEIDKYDGPFKGVRAKLETPAIDLT